MQRQKRVLWFFITGHKTFCLCWSVNIWLYENEGVYAPKLNVLYSNKKNHNQCQQQLMLNLVSSSNLEMYVSGLRCVSGSKTPQITALDRRGRRLLTNFSENSTENINSFRKEADGDFFFQLLQTWALPMEQPLFLSAGSVVFWQSGLHARICSWQKKHQYIVRGNFLNTDRYLTQCQLHEKSWFWKGGSTTPSGFTVKKIAISSCKNIILGHWAGSERNNIRTWSKYFSFLSCEKQVLDLTDKQCQ